MSESVQTFGAGAGENGGGAGVDRFAVHKEAVALGMQQPLDVGRDLVPTPHAHATGPAQEVTLWKDRYIDFCSKIGINQHTYHVIIMNTYSKSRKEAL